MNFDINSDQLVPYPAEGAVHLLLAFGCQTVVGTWRGFDLLHVIELVQVLGAPGQVTRSPRLQFELCSGVFEPRHVSFAVV